MDWMMALQTVVSYMEEHLLDDIQYDDVAAQIYVSNFHFHRTFAMLTGMSASTYLRNRRLTLAAQDLLTGNQKVIDVALKYGYESPESFTKAFRKYHPVHIKKQKKVVRKKKIENKTETHVETNQQPENASDTH